MENKTWSWRRKASEKTIVANGRASLSLERNVEEDKDREIGSKKFPSNLSESFNSVICDCHAKQELIKKHAKVAEQALAGQEMAEVEVANLKQELDKALHQGEAAEKRLAHLNSALNDCMVEIESLRHNALLMAATDFEKIKKKLEGKLAESNQRISNMAAENTNLMKALLCKEKLIEDLDRGKSQLEFDFETLLARLDSSEKENTFLKYETNKLEAECQQLRDLVRKRLQDRVSLRKIMSPEKPSKGTSFLIDRVYHMEEENRTLREILAQSDSELQTWRMKYDQMASRLEELEAENSMQLAISGIEVNDSESWANALLAELEQFRKGKIDNRPNMNDVLGTDKFSIVTSGHQSQSNSKKLSWLDEILKVILEEHRVSNRSFGELLREIEIVVGCKNHKEESFSGINGLLTWKSPNSTYVEDEKYQNIQDGSFAREKIRKHFGFDSKTLQNENREIKEKLELVNEENVGLRKKLQESNENIGSLVREVNTLKESKGFIEDQIENQRLINEDLDTQLTVAKAKLNELHHKLSSLEVELEHKDNCCEELEATCLELQLQLETLSRKGSPNPDIDQVAKKLKTETIQNLEKQLKAIALPDTMLLDKVLCPTTTITVTKARALFKKSLASQRSSLRDRMLAEDGDQSEDLESWKPKEEVSDGDSQNAQSVNHNDVKPVLDPELKAGSPEQAETLAIVPSKKTSGGFGFIRKLLLRRKRGSNKMRATIPLQRNTSTLLRHREVLPVV